MIFESEKEVDEQGRVRRESKKKEMRNENQLKKFGEK